MSIEQTLQPRPEAKTSFNYRFPSHRDIQLGDLQVQLFDLPGQYVASIYLVMDLPLAAESVTGISTLTMHAVSEGTKTHPGTKLSEALEDIGAEFGGRATDTAAVASMSVPVFQLSDALKLFVEILNEPTFDESDIERLKALRAAQIDRQAVDATSCANAGVRMAIFEPGSRYRTAIGGLRADVLQITPDQVRRFHHDWWSRKNAKLIIAGQLPDNVDQLVEQAFSAWEPTGTQHTEPADPDISTERKVWLIDRPDAVQSDIRIGGFGIGRTDPDWPALRLAATAVGGSFLSRLNKVLREDLGYTYGAHLATASLYQGGIFQAFSSVRNEVTGDALQQALKILDISSSPITDEELSDAKNYLLGSAPMHYDTAESIASQAATLAAVKLDSEYIDDYYRNVAAVTTDQANEVFTKIVKPDQCHIVICGNAELLSSQLGELGFEATQIELEL